MLPDPKDSEYLGCYLGRERALSKARQGIRGSGTQGGLSAEGEGISTGRESGQIDHFGAGLDEGSDALLDTGPYRLGGSDPSDPNQGPLSQSVHLAYRGPYERAPRRLVAGRSRR